MRHWRSNPDSLTPDGAASPSLPSLCGRKCLISFSLCYAALLIKFFHFHMELLRVQNRTWTTSIQIPSTPPCPAPVYTFDLLFSSKVMRCSTVQRPRFWIMHLLCVSVLSIGLCPQSCSVFMDWLQWLQVHCYSTSLSQWWDRVRREVLSSWLSL